jgi:WD40 repeat protein
VRSVAFSPDGSTLASAGEDEMVRLWDTASGASRRVLAGHAQTVTGLAFSADGRRLASSSGSLGRPGEVRLWDVATGQELLVLRGHTHEVTALALSPDGQQLASASKDETIRLWDAPHVEVDPATAVLEISQHSN